MKQSRPSWIWNSYLIFYLLFSGVNAFYFLFPDSQMYLYYQIGIAFNTYFFGTYFLNLTAVILNLISIIPLFLYIYRTDFLGKHFWCWFFVIRLAFDLIGHNYEMNLIKSLSYDHDWLGIKIILNYVLFAFPSYVALYAYAFSKISASTSKKIKNN